jgi:hypothetical protein
MAGLFPPFQEAKLKALCSFLKKKNKKFLP